MEDKEAMDQLRENLSRATTQTEIVESFYAVTQTAAQNCAVADAAAALETLAKVRAELEQYRRAPGHNALYFAMNVTQLLEPKP